MLTAVSALSATPIGNVGLIHFDAIAQVDGIVLEWATASELDTAGFRLQRVSDGEKVDLTDMIAAEGNPTLGAMYQFVDETAIFNTPYTYFLIEIELSAIEQTLASVDITANIQPTNTSIAPPPTANQPAQSPPTAIPTTEPIPAIETVPIPLQEQAVSVTPLPAVQPSMATSQQPLAVIQPTNVESTVSTVQLEPEQEAAQIAAQSTPIDGYPAPQTAVPQPTPAGYPINPTPVPLNINPSPYPAPSATVNGRSVATPQNLTTIGEDPVDQALRDSYALESAENTNPNPVRGRLYLWFGFILTTLIFGIAVVGSMLFFVRRN